MTTTTPSIAQQLTREQGHKAHLAALHASFTARYFNLVQQHLVSIGFAAADLLSIWEIEDFPGIGSPSVIGLRISGTNGDAVLLEAFVVSGVNPYVKSICSTAPHGVITIASRADFDAHCMN